MSGIAISDGIWKLFEPFMRDCRPGKHTLWRIWGGILWMLRTGAQWEETPRCYPPKSTVYWWDRWFVQDGGLTEIFMAMVRWTLRASWIYRNSLSMRRSFGRGRRKTAKEGRSAARVTS